MAISEEARHELYQALERSIGHEQATTLMELLPPVGWADVATRRDLEVLEIRLLGRFDRERGQTTEEFGRVHEEFGRVREEFGRVHEEFGRLHAAIAGQTRTIVLTHVATLMAAVGFAFAAARV